MTKRVFFHPKTLIKTKYKCQEEEKVEAEKLNTVKDLCLLQKE